MGRFLAVSFALSLALLASPLAAQGGWTYEPFSPDALDNLLAPVALYPDPLLAQVLVAATFPDQIDAAARFVRDDPNPDDVDAMPWDVSVKSVAHYPQVLEMMADQLDWTTSLGQAYVNQSTDVMASVQRLREQAQAEGSLYSTPEMQVVDDGGEIELWPAQPQYIYVPVYDPAVVFATRAPLFFGARLAIGAWLNIDFDWGAHRIFYHGWEHDRGWVQRSRPFVRFTNVYVNNSYARVPVNPDVVRRPVNYRPLNRYDDVHRSTPFDRPQGVRPVVPSPPPAVREPDFNKIIQRNVDTRDRRLYEYRGHAPVPFVHPQAPQAPAFMPAQGGFDPRLASRRGQESRAVEVRRQVPPPHAQPRREERKRR